MSVDGAALGAASGDFAAGAYSRLFLWNSGAAGTVDVDDVSVTTS
jgi:hypothetical protein